MKEIKKRKKRSKMFFGAGAEMHKKGKTRKGEQCPRQRIARPELSLKFKVEKYFGFIQ